jgi:hypothetical protein
VGWSKRRFMDARCARTAARSAGRRTPDACHELCRVLRAQQLLGRGAQPLVRHVVEVERRLAHLGHTSTQSAAVFRIEPQVQSERALDLPLGHRRQIRGGRLVKAPGDVVVALEQRHRVLDAEPRSRYAFVRTDAGQRRETEILDAEITAHAAPSFERHDRYVVAARRVLAALTRR